MFGAGKTTTLVIAMLALVPAIAESADTKVELRRNPFARPTIEVLKSNTATSSNSSVEAGDPGLRAVLVAGPKSVVNFGGVILQIGESTNGYELLAVEEDRAFFRSKGKRIVFLLYEQDEGGKL